MSTKRIAIIDFGMGNLFSVKRACEQVGLQTEVISDPRTLSQSAAAILPGVGAFGDAMENLDRLGLTEAIRDFINAGKPFLGICLGLQLLMTESEEFGIHKGLNIIEGTVVRFDKGLNTETVRKVPQVGWNKIYSRDTEKWETSYLKGLENGETMYFVHSFYVKPEAGDMVTSETVYEGIRYCSSVQKDNVFACQFHPEKSAGKGLIIYNNFKEEII